MGGYEVKGDTFLLVVGFVAYSGVSFLILPNFGTCATTSPLRMHGAGTQDAAFNFLISTCVCMYDVITRDE